MIFYDQALGIPMVQPLWIVHDLFLADQSDIYPIMERDKKNTPINAEDSSLKDDQNPDVRSACIPSAKMPPEINGPKGPEPTRFGDWEQKGRCTDF